MSFALGKNHKKKLKNVFIPKVGKCQKRRYNVSNSKACNRSNRFEKFSDLF